MHSDDEFRLLSQSRTLSPLTRPLHRISSASTLKSIYIDTPANSVTSSLQPADLHLISQAQLKMLLKPITLNIMVLGDSNTGKTSLIHSILIKHFKQEPQKFPNKLRPTKSLIDNFAMLSNGELDFKANLIDTPGYGFFSSREKWLENIVNFIVKQSQEYKRRKKNIENRSDIEDTRVNAAIYLIEGPRCKESDLDLMSKLQRFVNLIPVIAKADSYTANELIEVKLLIISQCAEAGIEFFDTASAMQENIHVLTRTDFAPVPPFAMISAGKLIITDGPVKFVREYPWGLCNIHNKSVSDFKLLCKILFGYIVIPLIKTSKHLNKQNIKIFKAQLKAVKQQVVDAKRQDRIRWISNVTSRVVLHWL